MKPKKNIHFLALTLIMSTLSVEIYSQEHSGIIAELDSIYNKFEQTVKNKNRDEHRSLYLYETVPVEIIAKTPAGPKDYYSTYIDSWSDYFSTLKVPYELKISEVEFEILADGIAVSEARFEEYESGILGAIGTDLFTYIKTGNGWKLVSLHNTVVNINDSTDYSVPIKLKNSLDDLPGQFRTALKNRDKSELTNLFHNQLSPYLFFKGKFDGAFNYPIHSIGGMINRNTKAPNTLEYEYSNIKTRIVDQYIGVISMDYKLHVDGREVGQGKQVWISYATIDQGWEISSIYISAS